MLKFVRAAVAGVALAAAAPAAAGYDTSTALISVADLGAGNYSFTQGDWYGGGLVTGFFSGQDLDGNLQLDWEAGEISGFSFDFSGNGYVQAFTLGFADLLGLVYDLDGGPLGDGYLGDYAEGIAAGGFSALYVAGPGPLDFCGEGYDCAVLVNFVPEPANWAMLIAGFGLTGAVMRRRRYLAA